MNGSQGLTLIELLTVMFLMAIIGAIIAPSFNTVVLNSRINSSLSAIRSGLTLARSEAISQGATVSICSSSNGTTCSGTTDWRDGWIVFIDDDDDGTLDSGEELIRSFAALVSTATLVESSAPPRAFQTFNADGSVDVGTGITLTLNIDNECASTAMPTLAVNNIGRVEVIMQVCTP